MQVETISEPSLTGQVKLVIWDLDDIFWKGTLSEEDIIPIPENIELVKALARRGIISSICSKNDEQSARDELRKLGVWDYFVLPQIGFHQKGEAISLITSALQLRPENVVFIDDNPSVLAEAAFACPGITALNSTQQLASQLECNFPQSADDHKLTRLIHYRQIAEKHQHKSQFAKTNEDFLRQSEIRIEIDYAVENHVERIVELINRSNQLNYTKIRIADEAAEAELVNSFGKFGFNAGVVRVWDKYGDYGVVGFFMTLATLREYRLEHFVFSCRIMNMGVEQFIYDYLKRPEIEIARPVANEIRTHDNLDWIEFGDAGDIVENLSRYKLVLIGGCDMLQLATYCSGDSREFTNRDVRGMIKRLDDPFMIIGDVESVRASRIRHAVPAFDADEMVELRQAVGGADALILSFYRMMEINYFYGRDGLTVRFDEDAVKAMLASDQALWFVRNFQFIEFAHEQRQALIRQSLEQLSRMARPDCKIIMILENIRKLENFGNEAELRGLYNQFIVEECQRLDKLTYIDINDVTNRDWLFDDGFHMSRQGYFELAQSVRRVIEGEVPR